MEQKISQLHLPIYIEESSNVEKEFGKITSLVKEEFEKITSLSKEEFNSAFNNMIENIKKEHEEYIEK